MGPSDLNIGFSQSKGWLREKKVIKGIKSKNAAPNQPPKYCFPVARNCFFDQCIIKKQPKIPNRIARTNNEKPSRRIGDGAYSPVILIPMLSLRNSASLFEGKFLSTAKYTMNNHSKSGMFLKISTKVAANVLRIKLFDNRNIPIVKPTKVAAKTPNKPTARVLRTPMTKTSK